MPSGIQTAKDHSLGDFPSRVWKELNTHIPQDLTGWKILDIGCNAGFYTFELAKRGGNVLGIDLDSHYLSQAKWAAKILGLEDYVSFRHMQVYDLANLEEEFDLVWFMGVFYHLRYPLLALDIVAQKVKKMMVFQTLMMPDRSVKVIADDYNLNDRKEMLEVGWPKMAFIEKKLSGDPTNWWAPNHAAVEAMLRTSGLEVILNPMEETYICTPSSLMPSNSHKWNRSEFLSAIGRPWQDEVSVKLGKGTD